MYGRAKDLTGLTFGSLIAIEPDHKGPDGTLYWKFKCNCGNNHVARGNTVTYMAKKGDPELPSCGCIELQRKTKHGFRTVKNTHAIYRTYRGMIDRCYNPKSKAYKWYGKVGVTVCDEWKNNPESFFKWSIDNGWFEKAHLDKDILSDKLNIHPHIYSPETCEWVDAKKNIGYATNRNNYGSHPNVKLSHNDVANILARINQGESRFDLALEYQIHESSIRRLVKLDEV